MGENETDPLDDLLISGEEETESKPFPVDRALTSAAIVIGGINVAQAFKLPSARQVIAGIISLGIVITVINFLPLPEGFKNLFKVR